MKQNSKLTKSKKQNIKCRGDYQSPALQRNYPREENAITLIALIITIIILVILAAVSIKAVYDSRIVGIAVNGTKDYAKEAAKENALLDETSNFLGKIIDGIYELGGETKELYKPELSVEGTQGNNEIYTSDVKITIKDTASPETTGASKLHYQITGAGEVDEQVVEATETEITIDKEGTSTITAWFEDTEGNISEKAELTITIDKTAPTSPTISLTGEKSSSSEYYKTDVEVTIATGTGASGISEMIYKVEGAYKLAQTTTTEESITFTIDTDGTSTITAYVYNNAGVISDEITQLVSIDRVAPTGSIEVSSYDTKTITVKVSAEDSTSGISSYEFQRSTDDTTWTPVETVESLSDNQYTYSGLSGSTTYYLRMIVTDRAGNQTTTSSISETTAETFRYDDDGNVTNGTITLAIGDYIDYSATPTDGTALTYVSPVGTQHTSGYLVATTGVTQGNGYFDQTFRTSSYTENWRVLRSK